jgi:hypothetical protein
MAIKITPGPLVADGTRITVTGDISSFVSGTDVANIGRNEASAGGILNFVTSATDPPPASQRDRTTLWFARGDGRLYKWTLNPTGVTGGRWLSISERREALFHITGEATAPKNELCWLSTSDNASEPNPVQRQRFGHRVLSLAAFAEGSASSRALMIGPFRIVRDEDTAVGSFAVGVELGFATLAVDSTSSPLTMVGKTTSDLTSQAQHIQNAFDWESTYTGLGYVTESGPKVDGQAVDVFFFGDPTHLTG